MKTPTVDDILEAMRDVIDPELGINIVDLGLVYDVTIDENNAITITLTLTSAACPLQDVIESQIDSVLINIVSRITLNWVWVPAWNPTMVSDDGREQLSSIGYSV
jgi:metal-sulfur cluster biosynthetic enzyme